MTETTPAEAIDQYLTARKQELTGASHRCHSSRLSQFQTWAEQAEDFTSMEELSGMHIQQFKNWRTEECGVSLMTLQQNTHTVRVFVEFCESVGIVEENISDKILVPKVPANQQRRDVHISKREADDIREELRKYHYGEACHVIFEILWDTACRKGALHALDVQDWHSDERYLTFRHRPETGTPLKLKEEGERNVTIVNDQTAELLVDYIADTRNEQEEPSGRRPLITTNHGRMTRQSITRNIYKVTRRCFYNDDSSCLPDCEGQSYPNYSKCKYSVSPHACRRGAITAYLDSDVNKTIVSGRANVSEDTLSKHYDARTREQRRNNRSEHLAGMTDF